MVCLCGVPNERAPSSPATLPFAKARQRTLLIVKGVLEPLISSISLSPRGLVSSVPAHNPPESSWRSRRQTHHCFPLVVWPNTVQELPLVRNLLSLLAANFKLVVLSLRADASLLSHLLTRILACPSRRALPLLPLPGPSLSLCSSTCDVSPPVSSWNTAIACEMRLM